MIGSDGRVAGTVTDRDICMAAVTQGRALHEISVATACSDGVVVIGADEPIAQAELLMARERVRRLPVVDDAGRPIGILSLRDIARYACGEVGASNEEVAAIAVTRRLAAIGEPNRAHRLELISEP